MFRKRRRTGRRVVLVAVAAVAAAVGAYTALSSHGARRAADTTAASVSVPAPPRPVAEKPKLRKQPGSRSKDEASRLRLKGQPSVGRLLRQGYSFYCGSSTVREVAITFDDGPSRVSGAILTLLRRAHAPATFFQIGVNASRRPKLAREEAAAGEVGNHTLDHHDLAHLPAGAIRQEIAAGERAVTIASGSRPVLFRPPYDATDPLADRLVRRAGLLQVFWSVDSRDWQNGNPAAIRQRVDSELAAGGIILLHEQADHTISTLRWLLADLKRRHLRPVTVSRLLVDAPPTTGQLQADRRGRTCVEFPYR
jgi:peptidoglycan/xylan/chitin deacetylase (PgdA/CDA1 family)